MDGGDQGKVGILMRLGNLFNLEWTTNNSIASIFPTMVFQPALLTKKIQASHLQTFSLTTTMMMLMLIPLSLVGRVRLGNHLTNPVPTKTHRCSVNLWFFNFFYISIFLWWWWWYWWWLCHHENVNNNDGDDDVSIAWSAMCIFWSGKKSSAKSHKR